MLIFDFVLRGAWKPMSKSMGSGAAWMLILVVATTMFVAADSSSWLSSDEKKPSCLRERKFEGACKDLNVDVQSKSGTIKAKMHIKKGTGAFDGSITIGSCKIPGTFSADLQVFNIETIGSFTSTIQIVATSSGVTLQGKNANEKHSFCQSAFTPDKDGVKTNIKLHVDTENIVSLELDSSVDVVEEHNEEPGFWTRTWNSMALWLWIIIFIICFVLLGLIVTGIVFAILRFCCCCKKPEKADLKASNANLENGNKQVMANAKVPNGPKDKLQNAVKKPEADVKGEKKDNEAVKKDNAVKKDKKVPEIKPKDEKKVAVALKPSNQNSVVTAKTWNDKLSDSSKFEKDNTLVTAIAIHPEFEWMIILMIERRRRDGPDYSHKMYIFPIGLYPKIFLDTLMYTFPVFEWANNQLLFEAARLLRKQPLSEAQYNALVKAKNHWERIVLENARKGHQERPTRAFAIMFILHVIIVAWNTSAKRMYEAWYGLHVDDDNTQRETETDKTQYDIDKLQDKIDKYMTTHLIPFTMPPNTDMMNKIKWTDVHQNYERLSKYLLECFDVTNISQYQLEGHMRKIFDVNPLKPKEAKVFQQKHEELKAGYEYYLSELPRNVWDSIRLYQIIVMILYCYEENQKTKTSYRHKAPFFGWLSNCTCCCGNRRRR
ncbi:hypothetical protein M3Y95_00294400 [Aphelenchoides besseyi]|nr:hypothetical protein M3Y95_00294400 [Aphelenchoides besseyi]